MTDLPRGRDAELSSRPRRTTVQARASRSDRAPPAVGSPAAPPTPTAQASRAGASRLTSAEKTEVAELRRRNRQLEVENEIQKRASYFAQENVLPR